MTDFIRAIPSDSTIQKIDIENNTVTIYVEFDIEVDGKLNGSISFEKFHAIQVMPGWQKDIDVSGVAIENVSELLEKVKELLRKDEVPENNIEKLKSYQVVSASSGNKILIEVIAQSHIVR